MRGDFDYTIGSGLECDVRLKQAGIEPSHAGLRRRGDRLFLRDLSAQAGAFVNGERIRPGRWVEVTRFDTVRLGSRVVDIGAELFVGRERLGLETSALHLRAPDGRVLCDAAFLRCSAGEMTAIMGPSGCGKSVLLSLLSGISQPEQGEIYLGEDRIPLNAQLHRISDFLGFVPQAEVLLPDLTVQASLDYRLRLVHPDMESGVRSRLIRRVCERLGFTGEALDTFLSTRIGAPEDKGRVLSGGQRRRASIAHELITEPLILFLDEPTSGLSSVDADEIVGLLASLAQRDGIAVIATIHQPSSRAFRLFDNLLLMGAAGVPLFHGKRAAAEKALASRVKATDNPAESLLALATAGDATAFVKANAFQPLESEPTDTADGAETAERSPGPKPTFRDIVRPTIRFATQVLTLLQRSVTVLVNDRANLWFAGLQIPVIALLILTTFAGAERDHAGADHFARAIKLFNDSREADSTLSTADRLRHSVRAAQTDERWISESRARQRSTVYFVLGLAAIWFGLLGASREVVTEQAVIAREGRAGIAPSGVLASKFLVQGGVACIQITGILVLVQPFLLGIGPAGFVELAGVLCLSALASVALGLALSAGVATYRAVMTLIPLVLIPQVLFGGLLRSLGDGGFDAWVSTLSVARWCFELALRVDPAAMGGVLAIDPPAEPDPDSIGIHQILQNLASTSETGLSPLFFPQGNPDSSLPAAVLITATLGLLALARVLMARRLRV